MKRVITVLIIFSLFNIYNAFALQCGSHVIAKGDTTSEVLLKCGEVTVYERWKEETQTFKVISYIKTDNKGNIVTNNEINLDEIKTKHFEEWTYNFGPKKLIYFLLFVDRKLIKIESGLNGFKEEDTGDISYSKCLSKIMPGDRVIEVTRHCGKANVIEYRREDRLTTNKARLKETGKYQKIALEIIIEDLTYLFKSQQLIIISFENGKVVKIDHENY
jgi:hypothetical protein